MADYGTDINGATDLAASLTNINGDPLLAQVICRRLYTPSGSLLSAPAAKTIDLRDYLSTTQNRNGTSTGYIRTAITQALLDDERILSVTVDLRFDPDLAGGTMFVGLTGYGANGPFALTLSVNSVTVEVLRQ